MTVEPSSSENENFPESPKKERVSSDLAFQSPLNEAFDSSLSEWRSAMKEMNPEENIQVAGMFSSPFEFFDSFRKWLYPPSSDAPAKKIEAQGQAVPNKLESFTTADPKKPPKIEELPVGGPQLEGRSRDVVTSWYSSQNTAMMEKFDPNSLTAAHRTLPFNTIVDLEFYNPKTGQTKIVTGVRINNDGPHYKGSDASPHVGRKPRELDVSPRVALELGLRDQGVDVGTVKMTIRQWGDNRYANGGIHPSGTDFRNKGRELSNYWGRSNFSIYK